MGFGGKLKKTWKSKVCKGNVFQLVHIVQNWVDFIFFIAGYLIPQGWCVLASFISVHMDEENYANPHQFNPWRWEVR